MPKPPQPIDPGVAAEAILQHEIERAAREVEQQATERVWIAWPKARPRYAISVYLHPRGDGFECASFAVTSLHPSMSVGTRVMRDIPVASLVREAIFRVLSDRLAIVETNSQYMPSSVVHTHYGADGTTSTEIGAPDEVFKRAHAASWSEATKRAAALVAQASGEGRGRRYPDGHLEEVARIVREARQWQRPAQAAVMEAFGLKRSAAANQIARARARGLLDDNKED